MARKEQLGEEAIGKAVLDAAFKVHSALGPGLLESVYEAALALELSKQGLSVERQKPVNVYYSGQLLEVGFRADLLVEGLVLVELKSVEHVTPLFQKIVTNYIRLIPVRLGFLINFNEAHLKNGIQRVTNGLEGKPFFGSEASPSGPLPAFPSPPSRPSRDIQF
ncbi:MAG: GxxExxY protein [Verrucomicrobiota bacterium]